MCTGEENPRRAGNTRGKRIFEKRRLRHEQQAHDRTERERNSLNKK